MFAHNTEALEAIRDGVRSLCSHYDAAYWRGVDERKAFPEEFVEVCDVNYFGRLATIKMAGWVG